MPQTLISWKIQEFEKHQKSRLWYIGAGIVMLVFLIYCVKTANFLFAVILLMAAVIVIIYDLRETEEVEFAITSAGIQFGDRIYPYDEFGRFWIVYEPSEVKKLYLEFTSAVRPRLAIPLNDEDPNKIRETLLNYVHEDLEEKDEPVTDYLGRVLKI